MKIKKNKIILKTSERDKNNSHATFLFLSRFRAICAYSKGQALDQVKSIC